MADVQWDTLMSVETQSCAKKSCNKSHKQLKPSFHAHPECHVNRGWCTLHFISYLNLNLKQFDLADDVVTDATDVVWHLEKLFLLYMYVKYIKKYVVVLYFR